MRFPLPPNTRRKPLSEIPFGTLSSKMARLSGRGQLPQHQGNLCETTIIEIHLATRKWSELVLHIWQSKDIVLGRVHLSVGCPRSGTLVGLVQRLDGSDLNTVVFQVDCYSAYRFLCSLSVCTSPTVGLDWETSEVSVCVASKIQCSTA